jgi:hypothetical protein
VGLVASCPVSESQWLLAIVGNPCPIPNYARLPVSGPYNHPEGVDGAKMAALWRSPMA